MLDQTVESKSDYSGVRTAMQRYVDRAILPGVSWALLEGRDLVDLQCVGYADRENKVDLRVDHIHRAFSNTKLFTTVAVLMLMEEGRLGLDDPVERYIPQLADRRVLKPDAKHIGDTVPANGPITIRHLLSHSAGLSYGMFDPGTLIFNAYNGAKIMNPETPLSDMIDRLADLPLGFHPGARFEYSIATDVLGRLVEILSGERFDAFLERRIFDRLGMSDTGFVVPQSKRDRFAGYYRGADLLDPMKSGLTRIDPRSPYPDAYLKPFARLSGGGGLVSTLPDMIALMRALLPGGDMLLKPETIGAMMANQLPAGEFVSFATLGPIAGKGFGLGGAVTLAPSPFDPPDSTGEFQWGGVAGTHWWINPREKRAGVLMTQRYMAFWDPFYFDFKRLVGQAHS